MSQRRSLLGQRPSVSEPPPRDPGKPWWTTPPISAPAPEHLAFAREFQAELKARATSMHHLSTKHPKRRDVGAILAYVNAWVKAANIHADAKWMQRVGLTRPDDVICEAGKLVAKLLKARPDLDAQLDEWDRKVIDTLRRHGARRRAGITGHVRIPTAANR